MVYDHDRVYSVIMTSLPYFANMFFAFCNAMNYLKLTDTFEKCKTTQLIDKFHCCEKPFSFTGRGLTKVLFYKKKNK